MITQQRTKGPSKSSGDAQKSRFITQPMPAQKRLSPHQWDPVEANL